MTIREDQVTESYATAVGGRLRSVRKQRKLSLQAVESMSNMEFKASVLGAYERGERSISVPRLQRLASLYGVSIDGLLPRDIGSIGPVGEGASEFDIDVLASSLHGRDEGPGAKVTIDLNRLAEASGPEKDALRRYLNAIQVQRQDFNGRMISVRSEDLRVFGAIFEMTAEQMMARLDEMGVRLH
ncbi:MAG: transcriptional regulator [Actinomycetota bacterium]|nr:transcriptional regulator [Actinomycetota bacterium]